MKAYVGVTDKDWFDLLASEPHLEEADFWPPGGNRLFKPHSPNDLEQPFFLPPGSGIEVARGTDFAEGP